MDKNLPKVYANPINKTINNNREVFNSTDHYEVPKSENILKKINEIFASPNHVYKSEVLIKTNNEEIRTSIVGQTNTYLLTLDGNKIRLNDIVSIDKI